MTPPGEIPSPRSSAAIAFAVAVTALGALPVWMLSAFAPAVQSDLDFDPGALGIAIGCFFAFSTLTGLPMGRLVERLRWRKAVAVTAILAGASLASIAFLAESLLTLILLLCIGAVANSTSQPAGNLAIASSIRDERQGMAFGIKQAALPISTFVVGLSVPLFADGEAWQAAYWAAAGAALLVLLAAASARLRALGSVSWSGVLRARWGVVTGYRPRFALGPGVPVPRALVLLAIGAGFGTAVTISLGGFTVSYAAQQGFTPADAGRLLALGSIVGIASRILSGFFADRRQRRHLVVVAAMMAAGAIGMIVLAFAGDSVVSIIIGVVLAFGLGWAWNGVFHLSVVRYATIPAAVATSVVQTAMSFGATFGPPLFGALAGWSYPAAWIASAVGLVIGAGFMLLGRRELRRGA